MAGLYDKNIFSLQEIAKLSSNALIFKHIHFSCGLYCGKLSQIVFGRKQGRSCIRKCQHTPVIFPGKSHGWRSLAGTVHGVAKSGIQLTDFIFTFSPQTQGLEISDCMSFPWFCLL